MEVNRYRTLTLALRHVIHDSITLTNVVDEVLAQDHTIFMTRSAITTPDGSATWDWTFGRWTFQPDRLAAKARCLILEMHTRNSLPALTDTRKKIQLIKELRFQQHCGLAEAKCAVEDALSQLLDEQQ